MRRGGEQKSDSLTAAPNGFSGEGEGERDGRRRHNEGAVTEAEMDSERWMEGETKRWRLYGCSVKMESKKTGGESEKWQMLRGRRGEMKEVNDGRRGGGGVDTAAK